MTANVDMTLFLETLFNVYYSFDIAPFPRMTNHNVTVFHEAKGFSNIDKLCVQIMTHVFLSLSGSQEVLKHR